MTVDPLRLREEGGIHRWIDLFELVAVDETGGILADYRLDEPSRLSTVARDAAVELSAVGAEDVGDRRSSEAGERLVLRAEAAIRRALDEAARISPRTAGVLEALGSLSHEALVQPFVYGTSITSVVDRVRHDDGYLPSLQGAARTALVDAVRSNGDVTALPKPSHERLEGLATDLQRLAAMARLHRWLAAELSEEALGSVMDAVADVAREFGMELRLPSDGFGAGFD